ncbi:hypothetical protein VPH35_036468 [Triticum aestivum]
MWPTLATSATNSLMPCLDSWDTLFTATSSFDVRSIPLYTLPNPPAPSRRLSSNPSVAWNRSLYENRCGPNSVSQSSRSSVYLSLFRTTRAATTPRASRNAAMAIGTAISGALDRDLGPRRGSFGSLVMSMAGAGASTPKLQPRM